MDRMSKEEMDFFKPWFNDHLRMGPVTVKFFKTDGSERIMNCTLKEDMITPYEKKTDRVKVPNDEVCAVWDLDKNEWRSFKYDNVIEVTFSVDEDGEQDLEQPPTEA